MEIMVAAEWGRHISAITPVAIEIMHVEVEDKVWEGYTMVLYLDESKYLLESDDQYLNIYPLEMVPHLSQKFRRILDMFFELWVFGMTIPSIKDATVVMDLQHSMHSLWTVLPPFVEVVVLEPTTWGGGMAFFKLDIKDRFRRMVVEQGK